MPATIWQVKNPTEKKRGLRPATGCMVTVCYVFVLFYVVLFLLFPHSDAGNDEPVSVWDCLGTSTLLLVPLNIYIFNRVYDRLKALDFLCLCLPSLMWLALSVRIGEGNAGLFGELVIVLCITGAYFLVFPFSKRFPGVSRTTISLVLVGLILIGVVFVVRHLA